jgi:6-phosphogluconolactonase
MAIDSSGKFAYVPNFGDNTISIYDIDLGTVSLTQAVPSTVATEKAPSDLTTDTSGKFLYATDSSDNAVSMFTINSGTGDLTPTSPAVVAAGATPASIAVSP